MIICLGMDNTGKSTLVQELSRKFDMKRGKSPGPVEIPKQTNWIIEALATEQFEQVVYDRFACFEEMIYGSILRNNKNPPYTMDSPIVKLLQSARPLIIYCRPPKDKVFNFGDREQYEGVIEKKETLLEAYDDLFFHLTTTGNWKVIGYDWTNPESIVHLSEVIDQYYNRNFRGR